MPLQKLATRYHRRRSPAGCVRQTRAHKIIGLHMVKSRHIAQQRSRSPGWRKRSCLAWACSKASGVNSSMQINGDQLHRLAIPGVTPPPRLLHAGEASPHVRVAAVQQRIDRLPARPRHDEAGAHSFQEALENIRPCSTYCASLWNARGCRPCASLGYAGIDRLTWGMLLVLVRMTGAH